MHRIDARALKVGDRLPEHVSEPITRSTLALFAGASNDHVRLHIDSDYAREAGMGDVFAHGMLSMAYLAQLLTRGVGQERIRSWNTRFLAITPIHVSVHCNGEVTELIEEDGERRARLKLTAHTSDGVKTCEGWALVGLD